MHPKKYLHRFAANVSKRSGISRSTLEVVLPHVFDEIRYQLTEGCLCVPIEAFGTFAVVDIPERQRQYTYKDISEIRTLPACKRLKFRPTKSFQKEIQDQVFDTTHTAFRRNEGDPMIRTRSRLKYNSSDGKIHIRPLKKKTKPAEPAEDAAE